MQLDATQAAGLIGEDLYDRDGDKVGSVRAVYEDVRTGRPGWAAVKTGLLGGSTLVPLAGATTEAGALRVPFEKTHIKDAPEVDPDGEISEQQERALFAYYGVDHEGPREPAGASGEVVTPSEEEEEVVVGHERVETARVRLRRWLVGDEVHTTVLVQREEVVLEREPVSEDDVDAPLGDDERRSPR